MTSAKDIELKTAEEMREPPPKKLPRGVKIIQMGDKTVFAKFVLGSWRVMSEKEIQELCL